MRNAALSQIIWHELLKKGEYATLPEGVTAVHQFVGAPHKATLDRPLVQHVTESC
jgi:hypothetical protein